MGRFLVTILTSARIDLLKNTLESIIKQIEFDNYDIFIIVNTTNELYYHSVIELFKNHSIEKLVKIIRTESNGKPGKGHNSLLSVFKHHIEYEYLVIVDGDDKLYPLALKRLNMLYSLNNYDVITLVGNTKLKGVYKNTRVEIIPGGELHTITTCMFIDTTKGIKELSADYNNIIATPGRLLSINRKVLCHYTKMYDERMFIYDDYKTFLIIYMEECFKKNLNILNLSDPYMYLYNDINTSSVHFSGASKGTTDEHLITKFLYNECLNGEELHVEKLTITPYTDLIKNTDDNNIIKAFHAKSVHEAHKYLESTRSNNKILFISGSDWNYTTIHNKPLGGTPSAVYFLTTELSKEYDIGVMTKGVVAKNTISNTLEYLPFSKQAVKDFNPDIIIHESNPYMLIDDFNDKRHILWMHHDINVAFVKQLFLNKSLINKLEKFIFVSNWQKNRFIQNFKLLPNKCFVMQNAISNMLYKTISIEPPIHKDKSLIYISTPYRGLLPAYHLFSKIKTYIPDIKFKIFSSFERDFNTNFNHTTFLPLTELNFKNDYDKYYTQLYELLIKDPNIDFYGSVPQKVLFEHMKTSQILFYPNTYPETCCTSILEAMACRCNIITSDLGALAETSNGFSFMFNPIIDVLDPHYSADVASTNPIQVDDLNSNYVKNFIETTIQLVHNYNSVENQQFLDQQTEYINNSCVWNKKADYLKKFILKF